MTSLPGVALAREVIVTLTPRGETLATCESLTGGLVAASLTAVPGSSAVVRGGLVTYASDLKSALAGVPAEAVERGVVTQETALAMARGARERCGATWAVATTGVAGPGPQDGVAAGTVWIAVAGPGSSRRGSVDGAFEVARVLHIDGERAEVRDATAVAALELLREAAAGEARGVPDEPGVGR